METALSEVERLNLLAGELRNHNMALSSQEAAAQASSLLGNSQNVSSDDIMTLRSNVRTLSFQLGEQAKLMAQMKERLSSMSQEMAALRSRPVAVPAASSWEKQAAELPMEACKPTEKSPVQAAPKQEASHFSESDIAIDKIFYFGQK